MESLLRGTCGVHRTHHEDQFPHIGPRKVVQQLSDSADVLRMTRQIRQGRVQLDVLLSRNSQRPTGNGLLASCDTPRK